MVVNSLSRGLAPSHGLRPGDTSQTARPAALAKDLPEKSFAAAVAAARDTSATHSNTSDIGQAQSALERARRQAEAAAEALAGETSESSGGRRLPGIALYERVSQYDASEPSISNLLKSWNEIMQGGQEAEGAAAAVAKALSRNGTLGFESGILDLTA